MDWEPTYWARQNVPIPKLVKKTWVNVPTKKKKSPLINDSFGKYGICQCLCVESPSWEATCDLIRDIGGYQEPILLGVVPPMTPPDQVREQVEL